MRKMNQIRSLQYESHNALALLEDGKSVKISYAGFHGKDALMSLDIPGLNHMLQELIQALCEEDASCIVRDFFTTTGTENGIRLIETICPGEFKVFWTSQARFLYNKQMGHSFRKTLSFITDGGATLSHLKGSAFVDELRWICDNISNIKLPTSMPVSVEKDNIRVMFLYANNNSRIYLVNNTQVSACSNRVHGITSEKQVLEAALEIRSAIQTDAALQDFTAKWGGSFVLRIINAVCPAESMTYFRHIAEDYISNRRLIEPSNILKHLNFSLNDQTNKLYVDALLSLLETVRNNSAEPLIRGNENEVNSNSEVWTMFYQKQGSLKYCRLDFEEIKNPHIRNEVKQFLRDRYLYDEPVTQLSRYFRHIRDALNIIAQNEPNSVAEITSDHVNHLQTVMVNGDASVSKISETLQVMGRFFEWACFEQLLSGEKNNPFRLKIQNKGRFQKSIMPVKDEAVAIVAAHLEELPEYVQIAFLLFLSTLSRANDVCSLKLSDIKLCPDGGSEWRYITKKNGVYTVKKLDAELTQQIMEYAEKTAELREQFGSDAVLLYCQPGLRKGSCRKPKMLDSQAFIEHIKKLLNRYGATQMTLNPRSIRAEGGRRLHAHGYAEYEIAAALDNTPAIAEKHYRSLTLHDEAELYHKAFQREINQFWDTHEALHDGNFAENIIFGSCKSETPCTKNMTCESCGYLCIREGGSAPW